MVVSLKLFFQKYTKELEYSILRHHKSRNVSHYFCKKSYFSIKKPIVKKQTKMHRIMNFKHLSRNIQKSSIQRKSYLSSLAEWATIDPDALGKNSQPHHVPNLVQGEWKYDASKRISIPNPLSKKTHDIFTIQDTHVDELKPFIESMASVSKSGVHNPLKNVHRYLDYGEISRKVK